MTTAPVRVASEEDDDNVEVNSNSESDKEVPDLEAVSDSERTGKKKQPPKRRTRSSRRASASAAANDSEEDEDDAETKKAAAGSRRSKRKVKRRTAAATLTKSDSRDDDEVKDGRRISARLKRKREEAAETEVSEDSSDASNAEEYDIEEIVAYRMVDRGVHDMELLVRWKGYGPDGDEWVPLENVVESEALCVFMEKLQAQDESALKRERRMSGAKIRRALENALIHGDLVMRQMVQGLMQVGSHDHGPNGKRRRLG